MSELRVPLNAKNIARLDTIDRAIMELQAAHNAICTGILDTMNIEITQEASVRRDGSDLVVTTPDNMALLKEAA